MPIPACCRKYRRDASIDIDELVHVEEQQAQARERVALQVIERGLALSRVRPTSERNLKRRFHGGFGVVAGRVLHSIRETLRLLDREISVHERQRLWRHGGALPSRTTGGRV